MFVTQTIRVRYENTLRKKVKSIRKKIEYSCYLITDPKGIKKTFPNIKLDSSMLTNDNDFILKTSHKLSDKVKANLED